MNENVKASFFKDLVAVQTELKNPQKNKQGYGYNYTTLDSLIDLTKPILQKHNLAIIQTLTGDGQKVGINTMLIHSSGESISETLWLPPTEMKNMNAVQAIGSSITYGRRYGISAILGISSEDDTDAHTETHKNTPNLNACEKTYKDMGYDVKTSYSSNVSEIELVPAGYNKGKRWDSLSIDEIKKSMTYYESEIASKPTSKFIAKNKEILAYITSIYNNAINKVSSEEVPF